MRIQLENGDFVSVDRRRDEPGNDLLLGLQVEFRCRGFAGKVDVFVLRERWEGFCDELATLERLRQGAATVEAASPGELSLLIRSVDSAGHMGCEGMVGRRGFDSESGFTWSAQPFDPSFLPTMVQDARRLLA